MVKPLQAFVKEDYAAEPTGHGVLEGLPFSVKDVFAVKGHTNAAGNPYWKRSHDPARDHADAIRLLLQQGARLRGITHTDELMYSLMGQNHHYGTPLNPKAPERLPGGSSSGSASAVAGGRSAFALGTDTGGSVRIPSAFCGIYGMRPTHGAVPAGGVIPLAESFDTVGWMAKDASVLHKVGSVLLQATGETNAGGSGAVRFGQEPPICGGVWLLPEELWALADEGVREALLPVARKLADHTERITLAPEGLRTWAECFRIVQGYEIWRAHGAWIERVRPRFGPGVAERFAWASKVTRAEYEKQSELRRSITARLERLLAGGASLLLPTAPCPAPPLQSDGASLDRVRALLLPFTCPAGLAGLPQLTIPAQGPEGCPVGLALIGGRHQDMRLLKLAVEWEKA